MQDFDIRSYLGGFGLYGEIATRVDIYLKLGNWNTEWRAEKQSGICIHFFT